LLYVPLLAPVLILAIARRRRAVLWAAAAVVLTWLVVIAAYRFDIRTLTPPELEQISATAYLPAPVKAAARLLTFIPIPLSLWTGVSTLFSNLAFEMPVYLLGKVWPEGNPWYFAVALAVKVPVSLWILMLAGGGALINRAYHRRLAWTALLWLAPGFLYIALASTVPLQLGVRLVLPALPFGLLIAAAGVDWLSRTHARQALLALLALVFLFETGRVYPDGIGFFNLAAGGPARGSHYLLDSNLDWGQGLPALESWARRNKVLPIRLSYFGADMPFRYFRGNEVELLAPPWAESLVKSDRLVPEPGRYYAIGATLIPGQFFAPKFKDYYAAFRDREPVARPGYAIFVYYFEPTP
ncbi:MAG: hypothetical protein SGI92_22630, partial [Bryobacteraceae bacterium]|nr:hypothetical protein [Bryobacteraceae bacterium]